jgi:adenylosuccinate lyase
MLSREIVASLVGQVPALCIVALLVWFIFKRFAESLDRMTAALDRMTDRLQKNTEVVRHSTVTMERLPESISRACRFQ